MLYGANGQVLARAPSRANTADRQDEVAIRAKLKSIDSLLDIKYVEWAGRYALICQWPQSDERWKLYQSGEIGEPYDALGWFCVDISDPSSLPVSIDSIENLILERLASCDNTKHHWKGRMKEIIEKNSKVRKSRQQEVIERTQEIAETLHFAAGHVDNHKLESILKEVEEGRV